MDVQDIRKFKVEILDEIFELAHDPVADPEAAKARLEAFLGRLEDEANGEDGRR